LDFAVPASKIATLSSGEFVGLVADDPDNKIALKIFHNEIINDHQVIRDEESCYKELPIVRHIDNDMIMANYLAIKKDIELILKKAITSDEE
jgi:hypothetical protein